MSKNGQKFQISRVGFCLVLTPFVAFWQFFESPQKVNKSWEKGEDKWRNWKQLKFSKKQGNNRSVGERIFSQFHSYYFTVPLDLIAVDYCHWQHFLNRDEIFSKILFLRHGKEFCLKSRMHFFFSSAFVQSQSQNLWPICSKALVIFLIYIIFTVDLLRRKKFVKMHIVNYVDYFLNLLMNNSRSVLNPYFGLFWSLFRPFCQFLDHK